MNVRGKTALITGASRGIGRAIALELAQQGAKCLILVARNHDRLNAVAEEVTALGTRSVSLPLDLSKTIEVNIAIAQVWRDVGPIDILINCAGVAHQSSFLRSRFEDVQSEIEVNLLGMYAITRMVARRMVVQRNGSIINVSSLMGKVAAPTMATYSATKFAIVGFTQALRGELAAYNIKVTALLPSLTDTDMAHDLQWFRWVSLMTPKQVAKALIAGLDREAPEILVGWQSHMAVWCHRLFPFLMEKILLIAAPKV